MLLSPRGRCIVLTGARQVGKSTLLKMVFPDARYINLDTAQVRIQMSNFSSDALRRLGKTLILDEIQKAPDLLEIVKASLDEDPEWRCILTGSSQLLLLDKVRESLAGRVALLELMPLTITELASPSELMDEPIEQSPFVRALQLMMKGESSIPIFQNAPPSLLLESTSKAQEAWDYCLLWGGMPILTHSEMSDEDRKGWLNDYISTYLERDLADIARLDRLEPFVRMQALLGHHCAQFVNYSDFARDVGVSVETAKRYLRYLEISYQVCSLPGWTRNAKKRLTKMHKVIWLDTGLVRSLTGHWGELNGHEYENAVLSEALKQIKYLDRGCHPYHLRTFDGREVDFILELPTGYVAIEVKQSSEIRTAHARSLREIDDWFDKPMLGKWIVSNDPQTKFFEELGVIACPAAWLFG